MCSLPEKDTFHSPRVLPVQGESGCCVSQPVIELAKIGTQPSVPTEVVHTPAVGEVGTGMVAPSLLDRGPRMDLIRLQSTAWFSCLVLGSVSPGVSSSSGWLKVAWCTDV